jgi:hypothetical protein
MRFETLEAAEPGRVLQEIPGGGWVVDLEPGPDSEKGED